MTVVIHTDMFLGHGDRLVDLALPRTCQHLVELRLVKLEGLILLQFGGVGIARLDNVVDGEGRFNQSVSRGSDGGRLHLDGIAEILRRGHHALLIKMTVKLLENREFLLSVLLLFRHIEFQCILGLEKSVERFRRISDIYIALFFPLFQQQIGIFLVGGQVSHRHALRIGRQGLPEQGCRGTRHRQFRVKIRNFKHLFHLCGDS